MYTQSAYNLVRTIKRWRDVSANAGTFVCDWRPEGPERALHDEALRDPSVMARTSGKTSMLAFRLTATEADHLAALQACYRLSKSAIVLACCFRSPLAVPPMPRHPNDGQAALQMGRLGVLWDQLLAAVEASDRCHLETKQLEYLATGMVQLRCLAREMRAVYRRAQCVENDVELPPSSVQEPRDICMYMRVTPEERWEIEDMAQRSQTTLTDVVVRGFMSKSLPRIENDPVCLWTDERLQLLTQIGRQVNKMVASLHAKDEAVGSQAWVFEVLKLSMAMREVLLQTVLNSDWLPDDVFEMQVASQAE